MTHGRADRFDRAQGCELAALELHTGPAIVAEILAVLAAHPGGLRRWSVMRAIRKERERTGQDIPQNFEAQVERTFQRFCADVTAKGSGGAAKDALFFRPSEKAGEVWAILRDSPSRNDEFAEAI